MYGFGDDRNPANDTVNVMEEILVEYIADVVSASPLILLFPNLVQHFNVSALYHSLHISVKAPLLPRARHDYPSKTSGEHCPDPPMRRSWLEWRNCCSCRRISSVRGLSSTIQISISQVRSNRADSFMGLLILGDFCVLCVYRSTGPTMLYIFGQRLQRILRRDASANCWQEPKSLRKVTAVQRRAASTRTESSLLHPVILTGLFAFT